MRMPRGIHKDAQQLHDILEKGVILNKDRVEGSVDLNDESPVYVGIIVDVNGYGPHVGALYVEQNRFHGHLDSALQGADEILEQWTLDNTSKEDIEELEAEHGDDWMSVLTETFDGWAFKLSPQEFVEAIRGTDAEKFVDVEPLESEEEEPLEESPHRRGRSSVRETSEEKKPLIRTSYSSITRGDSDDSDDYEEDHGWIDEEGTEFEPDESDIEDGMTPSESIVAQAVKFLKHAGASQESSTAFHIGVWYSTEYETVDYRTGEEQEKSFHLDGFSPEEEAEIFKQMTRRRN